MSINCKRIVLNVWTQNKGISAIAPGNEDCPENVLRSFVHRTDRFIKTREIIISKLYFSRPEGLYRELKVALNLFQGIVIPCF